MKKRLKNWLFKKLFDKDLLIFEVRQTITDEQLKGTEGRNGFLKYRFDDLGNRLIIEMMKKGAIVATREQNPDPLGGEVLTMKVKVFL